MFEKPRISYAVMVLLFFLPQSLYVIGDYMAWGIRFPFFRYQDSPMGSSLITINREVGYIVAGQVGVRTGIATGLWIAGVVALFAAAALILSRNLLDNSGHARYVGPLVTLAGVLFLVWAVVQYGLLLSGPSGYAVPIGVPALLFSGYQFMLDAKNESEAGDGQAGPPA